MKASMSIGMAVAIVILLFLYWRKPKTVQQPNRKLNWVRAILISLVFGLTATIGVFLYKNNNSIEYVKMGFGATY